jgi:hypothetical protein
MKAKALAFATVLVAVLMIAGAAVAAGHLEDTTTDEQQMFNFSDGTDAGNGVSHLTRTSEEALAVVEAEGLDAGGPHTLWWIVFNNPAGCTPDVPAGDPVCGEDDIFLPNGELNAAGVMAARIAIGNATGNIARADGTIELGGRLQGYPPGAAQVDDGHQILFVPSDVGGVGNNLLTVRPADAEFHLIVQGHGNARGGKQLLKQLSEEAYGCTPNCEDLQFTVHTP